MPRPNDDPSRVTDHIRDTGPDDGEDSFAVAVAPKTVAEQTAKEIAEEDQR